MYAILGWFNVILFVTILLPFLLRKANQHLFMNKNKALSLLLKKLRKVHKPLGLLLIFSAAIHGYLALGTLRLHTGTLLFTSILITATFGGAFYRLKKRRLFFFHRLMVIFSAFLLLLHLLFPGLISLLLR